MKQVKRFKLAIIVVALSLVFGLGGRLMTGPAAVNAARLFNYKVVTMGSANTVYEYEKLLNDMAFQGWEFDHLVIDRQWAVFRK